MKRKFIALVFTFLSFAGFSQYVGINTTGAAPDPSAGLDISFSNLGLLFPRIALTGTSAFSPLGAHFAGMLIYNTASVSDVTPGFYYNNGTKWIAGPKPATARGDMQYWNGTAWTTLSGGIAGQYLAMGNGGTLVWGGNVSGFATLTTTAASGITSSIASSGGNITNNGGTAVTARGVCWSTSQNPTIALSTKTSDGTGSGSFVSSIIGLASATVYYVRAYATNGAGTEYGNQVSFTTN